MKTKRKYCRHKWCEEKTTSGLSFDTRFGEYYIPELSILVCCKCYRIEISKEERQQHIRLQIPLTSLTKKGYRSI